MPIETLLNSTPRRFRWMSDSDLVGLALPGNMEACDELVRRYRGAVILAAEQVVGSKELAQDIAQEAFLLAFRSLRQLRDPEHFSHWLYTIARNRARRVIQQYARVTSVEDIDKPETPDVNPEACPVRMLLHSERQTLVQGALSDLPDGMRLVMSLFYIEQWTAQQIAEFLSLPLTTIHWRLHSGRKQMRHLLEKLEENYGIEKR
jgi:RNA polymerase sigma-70 factor, ECF subfamily